MLRMWEWHTWCLFDWLIEPSEQFLTLKFSQKLTLLELIRITHFPPFPHINRTTRFQQLKTPKHPFLLFLCLLWFQLLHNRTPLNSSSISLFTQFLCLTKLQTRSVIDPIETSLESSVFLEFLLVLQVAQLGIQDGSVIEYGFGFGL